jgi:hypothetical protein
MFLEDGTRDHFMKFWHATFCVVQLRYERLYATKCCPTTIRNRCKG